MYNLSIITLHKGPYDDLERTIDSILLQKEYPIDQLELIVIDGNKNDISQRPYNYLPLSKLININYIYKPDLIGIYPNMNYAITQVAGDHLIFLNSGDRLINEFTLKYIFLNLISFPDIIFCKVKIQSRYRQEDFLYFPNCNPHFIRNWLFLHCPHHQSLIVAKHIAKRFRFEVGDGISSDLIWKKNILNISKKIIYINKDLVGFRLDGISSRKISVKRLILLYNSSDFNLIFKILLTLKFFIQFLLDEENFFKILIFKSFLTKILVNLFSKLGLKYKRDVHIFIA